LVLAAIMIFTLVLAGCGPRPGQGELAASATDDTLVVDVPALYIDYDDQGQASVSGAQLALLGTALGTDLSSLDRTPEDIQKLKDAGIQNIFANITPAGVNVYANGQSLLSLAWTPETIANLGTVLAGMDNPALAQVQDLLPLLSNMSAGIVMRFPSDGEEAPLVGDAPDAAQLLKEAQAAAPVALGAVLPDEMKGMAPLLGGLLAGLPPLTIDFDANGVGTLSGLAPFIASQIPAGAISLPADQLESLKGMGIQSLNIKNSPDGLAIAINGNELPTLLWNRGEMQNLGTLGVDAGVLAVLAGLDEGLLGTLKQVSEAAPILQTAKLDVTINLP
jgi:hypothetical protein